MKRPVTTAGKEARFVLRSAFCVLRSSIDHEKSPRSLPSFRSAAKHSICSALRRRCSRSRYTITNCSLLKTVMASRGTPYCLIWAITSFIAHLPFVPPPRRASFVLRNKKSADTGGAKLPQSFRKCRRLRAYHNGIQLTTLWHSSSPYFKLYTISSEGGVYSREKSEKSTNWYVNARK